MSDLMKARAVISKKMNVMVRKIDGVTLFVLAGNDEHTPDEIYFVVGSADDAAVPRVFADLNFLIRQFLGPIDIQKIEAEGRTLSNYTFDNGLKAQVIICKEDHLPSFGWWVPYLDKNGAALGFYPPSSRKPSDPTTEKPENGNPFDGGFEDDFDDVPAASGESVRPEPVSAPEPVAAQNPEQPQAKPEPAGEQSERDMWSYFYGKVNVAKHAISGGSVIYACEIIGELRSLLIRLICEANGITEDYLHSIDLLPENHRAALLRTYPSKPENGPMISALAAELSIFEELMKRQPR